MDSFSVKDSLRTIDQVQRGNLMTNWPTSLSPFDLRQSPIESNSSNSYFLINNFFASEECQSILKSASEQYKFSSIEHAYKIEQREAKRLCLLNKELAIVIFQRLQQLEIFKNIAPDVKPYGYDENLCALDSKNVWTPDHVNECVRLSMYEAPSVGFKPHFDSQYTTGKNKRSIYSILIYLNHDYQGGNTVLYEKSIDDKKSLNLMSGLTIDEEIKQNKNLDGLVTTTIVPKLGSCLVFKNDILHEGTKISSGVKYILRTDLVFSPEEENKVTKNKVTKNKMSIIEKTSFKSALTLYNEAQNQELLGNVRISSELYERSLSMRRAASQQVNSLTGNVKFKNAQEFFQNTDVSLLIFDFLSMLDIPPFGSTCQLGKLLRNRHNALFWNRQVKKVEHKSPKKDSNQNVDKKLTCMEVSKLFIPHIEYRYGTAIHFQFPDQEFVSNNLQGCLRVLAVYTLFLFGHNANASTFIVHYDPVRKQAKRCSFEWLLTCAFYKLPCDGIFVQTNEDNENIDKTDNKEEIWFNFDSVETSGSNEIDYNRQRDENERYQWKNQIFVDENSLKNFNYLKNSQPDSFQVDIKSLENMYENKDIQDNKIQGYDTIQWKLKKTYEWGGYGRKKDEKTIIIKQDNIIMDFSRQDISIVPFKIVDCKQCGDWSQEDGVYCYENSDASNRPSKQIHEWRAEIKHNISTYSHSNGDWLDNASDDEKGDDDAYYVDVDEDHEKVRNSVHHIHIAKCLASEEKNSNTWITYWQPTKHL